VELKLPRKIERTVDRRSLHPAFAECAQGRHTES
jgi:hypothetical protein